MLALVFGLNSIDRTALSQAKKEPIKIGVVAEKTGGHAAYGYTNEKVIQAAVEEVNREGVTAS